jgi:hypothetical protein
MRSRMGLTPIGLPFSGLSSRRGAIADTTGELLDAPE